MTAIVPACILRAHERARGGHEGVHTQTHEAYGHGLYAAQYEELATGLLVLPYSEPVRLQARTVVVIAGHVIYPIRYAKKDVPVTTARLRRASGLRADLIRRHGPEPRQFALDLDIELPEEDEPHADLLRLSPGTRLVIVAYACSLASGVVRLEWGSAELRREDRSLLWHHHEPLPIPGGSPAG
ncbi:MULTISPECIES: hypothetical protein [Kitasatospora]|uniref:UbiC transcription regulator-associated domain-containing protein n=1 Tax=Kitasatospora cathayae TaxID=3004092 RepID=A0ABY7QH33_9ACTN|nr:hypothetical protein [Kitasatospora sp. HUAS 3-15]WBP92087.1 hypothetical protein O1G21_40875 [Kitasatospora sp. HUAS 3-15]